MEREVVFLADKFVRGTQVVPLDKRYGEKLRQWAHDPEAVQAIQGRLERARTVCERFETESKTRILDLAQQALNGPAAQATARGTRQ